jgi:hypothetical protein
VADPYTTEEKAMDLHTVSIVFCGIMVRRIRYRERFLAERENKGRQMRRCKDAVLKAE